MPFITSYLDTKNIQNGAINGTTFLDTDSAVFVMADLPSYVDTDYQVGGGIVVESALDTDYFEDAYFADKADLDVSYRVFSIGGGTLQTFATIEAGLIVTDNAELTTRMVASAYVTLDSKLASYLNAYSELDLQVYQDVTGYIALQSDIKSLIEVTGFTNVDAGLTLTARVELSTPFNQVVQNYVDLNQNINEAVENWTPIRSDILSVTPVEAYIELLMPIRETQVSTSTLHPTVTVSGETIPLSGFSIDMDEGEPEFRCRFLTNDVSKRYLMRPNALVQVAIGGDNFTFYLDSYRINRNDPQSIGIDVDAVSYGAFYDNPRADSFTKTWDTDTLASVIVSELLSGASIAWGILDWVIPAYRVAIDDGSPIGLAMDIVEAAGGVLEPDYAGGFAVRYRHPSAIPTYPTLAPDYNLYTSKDILQMPERMEVRDYADRYRILDVDTTDFTDVIQFEANEDDATERTGTLRVWPYPYDETVTVSHTGDNLDVILNRTGVITTAVVDEIVEFTEGQGSTQFPIASIDGLEWLSRNLLGVVFEPYTSELTSTHETEKYSLLKISYQTTAIHYSVSTKTSEAVQFLVNRSV